MPIVAPGRVTDALREMFFRVRVTKYVLGDRGTNFAFYMIREAVPLFPVRQLQTRPYHPMTNTIVET